jgi:cardiolipin synthase A/B
MKLPNLRRRLRPAPTPPAGPVTDLAYAYDPEALRAGHAIDLLLDGDQAFPAMLDGIAAAERYVHLEMYILRHDHIGNLFREALVARARAGVKVRIIVDAVGSISLSMGYIGDLLDAGIEFLEYRPLARWRTWGRWSRRNHRKVLIIDGRFAYTGGLNIGLEYAPRELGGEGWRDTNVRIEGPIVADLEALFWTTWHGEGGRPYDPIPVLAAPSDQGGALAGVVGNAFRKQRTGIRRSYLHAIYNARRFVYIANAYFVPDAGVRRALVRAAKRGVDVRVIVPEHSDLLSVQYAGERTYARLLRGGVGIYQWPETHMHAKTAVVDGVWSTVGSYNLDYVSLFQNLEVNVQVVDRDVGAQMQAMHEADLARCRALDLATWKKRPWWQKLLERVFYRFRRWL